MSVELKDLEVGSVVVDIRGAIGIILKTNHTPLYPILFAIKASGSRYKAQLSDLRAVIGKADINAFNGALDAPVERPVNNGTDYDFLMPEPLKSMGLKIGDKIKVKEGFAVVEAIFDGYKPSRPKYPVSFTVNGRSMKGTIGVIIGKAA